MSLSLIWPFDEGAGWNSYTDEDKNAAVKQNLRFLLLTRPGEYTMDLDFGVGIQRLLFQQHTSIGQPIERIGTVSDFRQFDPLGGDPNLPSEQEKDRRFDPNASVEMIREPAVISRIHSQVAKYMPYINISSVDVNTSSMDTNQLGIRIVYSINLPSYAINEDLTEQVLEIVEGVSIGSERKGMFPS
jgi:predicted component of type VI protein secretion system